ncbi:MAG TPA: zf-TFIIB domain-containing protein [Kofleriaceae bacterium]|nr:zf-TFIIB domain-containing protein [Kofleriaceae bacterium]
MHCPRCHTSELVERERLGISIDLCSSCRGVWLDRGELDKLIARSRDAEDDDDVEPRQVVRSNGYRHRKFEDDDDDDRGRHRRRSWWDIFD